jgi:hypothetical protein
VKVKMILPRKTATDSPFWRPIKWEFYGWPAIVRSAWTEPGARDRLRHLAYTAGWKKMEPVWGLAIRHGRVQRLLPLLETLLTSSAGREVA